MKKLKKQNGITLVALVITIIILLILAGISISALTNQGLFAQANRAKDLTAQKSAEENEMLANYLAQMNAYSKKTEEEKFKNVDTTETNPEGAMPKDSVVIEGDAKKGIVIKDSNDNEWTWVEVPMSVTTGKTSDSEIEDALKTYATEYREGATGQGRYWTDEWYDGCGMSKNEYNTAKSKMLQSIKINGGFWISRYEIGDSTATANNATRKSDSGTSGVAVSKPNQIPYNYVTCEQAQTLAKGMSADSSKTSSLLFGIQWDLTCKFLETKTNHITDDIKTNSTSWGNYKNNSLTLYRGKYNINPGQASSIWKPFDEETKNYVTNKQTSSDANYKQLLTTGASEGTNKMNIYDFAGNEWEWTLEHATSDTRYPCARRGGSFKHTSSDTPVAYRDDNSTSSSNDDVGFRSTLY